MGETDSWSDPQVRRGAIATGVKTAAGVPLDFAGGWTVQLYERRPRILGKAYCTRMKEVICNSLPQSCMGTCTRCEDPQRRPCSKYSPYYGSQTLAPESVHSTSQQSLLFFEEKKTTKEDTGTKKVGRCDTGRDAGYWIPTPGELLSRRSPFAPDSGLRARRTNDRRWSHRFLFILFSPLE